MMTLQAFASRLGVTPDVINMLTARHFCRPDVRSGLFNEDQYLRIVRNDAALIAIKRHKQQLQQQQDQARQLQERQSASNLPGRRDNERRLQEKLDQQSRIAELSEERAKERKQQTTNAELAALREELQGLRDELRAALSPINDQADEVHNVDQ